MSERGEERARAREKEPDSVRGEDKTIPIHDRILFVPYTRQTLTPDKNSSNLKTTACMLFCSTLPTWIKQDILKVSKTIALIEQCHFSYMKTNSKFFDLPSIGALPRLLYSQRAYITITTSLQVSLDSAELEVYLRLILQHFPTLMLFCLLKCQPTKAEFQSFNGCEVQSGKIRPFPKMILRNKLKIFW